MSDKEYQKLEDKLGDLVADFIERLSVYMQSKGTRYKDHYATILNWHRRDGEKDSGRRLPKTYTPTSDYPDL